MFKRIRQQNKFLDNTKLTYMFKKSIDFCWSIQGCIPNFSTPIGEGDRDQIPNKYPREGKEDKKRKNKGKGKKEEGNGEKRGRKRGITGRKRGKREEEP